MTHIAKSVCWAAAMIAVAILSIFGVIEREVATTLFIVLPIVAATSLTGRRCSLANRGEMK